MVESAASPPPKPTKGITMGRRCKPITIRGIQYGSMKEAADALGISLSTIKSAKTRGTLEYAGLGWRESTSTIKNGERRANKPVTIRGVEYPSQTIAAEVLGVNQSTISSALKNGRLDFVGLGQEGWRDDY